MRHLIQNSLLVLVVALGAACSSDQGTFRNALTGEECEPNDSFVPLPGNKGENGNGGHNSPTGIPGDNMDDESSGQIDCLYDGDSGQGNDERTCIPAGCDDQLCCEVPPDPDQGDDGSGDDGSGDDGSGDDGSGDDGSGDDGSGDDGGGTDDGGDGGSVPVPPDVE